MKNNGHIVLISNKVQGRVGKIGYALKENNYEVSLLYTEDSKDKRNKKCFDQIYYCKNKNEVLKIARLLKGDIYHLFSSWNFEISYSVINENIGKTVFDDYDVLPGMVNENYINSFYSKQVEIERECFKKADGICCRSLEFQYAKKKLKYKTKGKIIYFPDYCWGLNINKVNNNMESNEIHVVYAGNLNAKNERTEGKQISVCHYKLAEKLNDIGVHFHLYPSLSFKDDFEIKYKEFRDLEKRLILFHLHTPIENEKLINEMVNYDIGLQSDYKCYFENGNKSYTPLKRRSSCSNKIFDYLDAELGVLIGGQRLQEWMLSRKGASIFCYEEDIPELIKNIKKEKINEIKENSKKAKKSLSINKHINRLIEFYQQI